MLPGPLLVSLLLSLHGPAADENGDRPARGEVPGRRQAAGRAKGRETRKGEPARGGAPKVPVVPAAQIRRRRGSGSS